MTALLINDLRDKKSVSHPNTKLRNPLELFASGSFHGGVWRTGTRFRFCFCLAIIVVVVLVADVFSAFLNCVAYTFGSVGSVSVIIHFVKVLGPYLAALLLLLFAYKFLL
jgi:hypothetical protein